MWKKWFEYTEIVFCTPDKNEADRNRTKQELLFFNILLPEAVSNRPTIVCKGESPDFTVQLADSTMLYVEVVTAVATAHEDGAQGNTGIQQEHRWAQIRKGKRENKRYTTNGDDLARIVAKEVKKKRCLAETWAEKRPIILLVGLVGVGGLLPGIDLNKYVESIRPFESVIIGDGTIRTRILKDIAEWGDLT